MRNKKKLPVGIESFEKIIEQNFYYIDKTSMIAELLAELGRGKSFYQTTPISEKL